MVGRKHYEGEPLEVDFSPYQLSKSDGIKVSNLEAGAWQQRSIGRSNLAVDSESC